MRKGVTLLEMILVMALIAVTAAMAMPNLQKGMDQKRADSAIANLRTMSHCLRLYRQEHDGAYPPTWGVLERNIATGGNGCFDRSLFEKNFVFPASDDPIPAPGGVVTILAADNPARSTRSVCLVDAGTLDRSGKIYDVFQDGCGSTSAYLARTLDE